MYSKNCGLIVAYTTMTAATIVVCVRCAYAFNRDKVNAVSMQTAKSQAHEMNIMNEKCLFMGRLQTRNRSNTNQPRIGIA